MEKLGIGVVGFGGMGTYHVKELIPAAGGLFSLQGIYDLDPDRRKAAVALGLKSYDSQASLLADPQIAVVLIATPNDSHKEIAIAAMQAGKHVLCEKPVALNTQELTEILAVAEETGQTFMVHQNRRWDPDFLMIREMYQQQLLGEVFQIESRVHGANGIPGDWRHEKAAGGGMLLDWGVHLIDQLLWLVPAAIQRVDHDLSYILGNDVDDGFILYLTFDNGLKTIIEVGTTNYVKLPRWYIKGTKGTAKIDDWDLSGEMILATGNTEAAAPAPIQAGVGLTKTMAPPSEEAMEVVKLPKGTPLPESLYENLYQVIATGAEPIIKNEEVLAVMQLMDQILAKYK